MCVAFVYARYSRFLELSEPKSLLSLIQAGLMPFLITSNENIRSLAQNILIRGTEETT